MISRSVENGDTSLCEVHAPLYQQRRAPRALLLLVILGALVIDRPVALRALSSIVLYQNNFEAPNTPIQINCATLDSRGINFLYGTSQGTFQQVNTVEALRLKTPQSSDPSGIGGNYAIGMLSAVQNDLLALTFDSKGKPFINVAMDISALDVAGCGGPFGVAAPKYRLSLVNSPGGVFSFGSGAILAQQDITGVAPPNQFTTNWTHHVVSLSTAGSTDGKVTLVWDLLQSGYAVFDNLIITASDDAGDLGKSPGGVFTGAGMWLQANSGAFTDTAGTTSAGDGLPVRHWQDPWPFHVNVTNSASAINNPRWRASSALFNFNPTLDFDLGDRLLSGNNITPFTAPGNNSELFVVANETTGNQSKPFSANTSTSTNSGFNQGDYPLWGFLNGGAYFLNRNVTDFTSVASPSNIISNGLTYLVDWATTHTSGSNGTVSITANGRDAGGGAAIVDPARFNVQIGESSSGDNPTDADVAEMVVYNANLTAAQRLQVRSYLATKYGITLGNTTTPANYTASDGTTVYWNGDVAYQNGVAGVGRDDAGNLDQRVSHSVDAGMQPLIANGATLQTVNPGTNTAFSADRSYVTWGHNNGTLAIAMNAPSGYLRMARAWKTKVTGTGGGSQLTIQIPQTVFDGLWSGALLVSTDPAFGIVTRAAIPLTCSNETCSATFSTFSAGEYFTFAAKSTPPDTTPPLTTILSTIDGSGSAVPNGGVTESTAITFTFSATDNIAVAKIQCSVDGGSFIDCTSPRVLSGLSRSSHTFAVSAIDTSGNVESSVPTFSWTIVQPPPDLAISKTHTGNFFQGQVGATYTLTVSNVGAGPTSAAVTASDILPAGLTATTLSGSGWTCALATLTCTRTDGLAAGGAFAAITAIVNVGITAPATLTNTAAVSGGGETNTFNNSASDATVIVPAGAVIAESHFISNDEGWRVGNMFSPTPAPSTPTFSAAGGNPGGYIRTGDVFLFNGYLAPSAFVGNQAAAYGGTLRFDMRELATNEINHALVAIGDGNINLTFPVVNAPSPVWTSFSIQLSASAGWRVAPDNFNSGSTNTDPFTLPAATEAQLQQVLGNLQLLRINADFISGADQVDLDNVLLTAATQACVAPSVGLVSWWGADGNVLDLLGRNSPSASAGVSFVPAKVQSGFAFDSGGYIDIPASQSLANQQFTIAAWVRPDGPGPNADAFGSVIVGQVIDGSHAAVQVNWRSSDNRFMFLFGDTAASEWVLSQHSFPPGQFYFVTASYDGARFSLFVNGALEGISTVARTMVYASTPWTIGSTDARFRGMGIARTWNGIIDEVQILSRSLSVVEIQDIFSAGSVGECKPPTARTPTIAWPDPPAIVYGTLLSTNQLNATASFEGSPVPGTFAYTPASGTLLAAGSRTLSVVFTPNDTATYATVNASVPLAVNAATPVVSVTGGQFIFDGTARTPTSIVTGVNGSSVAGLSTYSYVPGGSAAPINIGTYSVTATFTSADPNYVNVTGNTTTITITPATPTLTIAGTFTYDGGPHAASVTTMGPGGVSVPGSLEPLIYTPGGSSPPVAAGTYSVTANFTSGDPNFFNVTSTGTITVNRATPTLIVTGGSFIFDGLPHLATASASGIGGASVPGTVAVTYFPGGSSAPITIGNYAVAATFTSSNPNYSNRSGSASITISPLSPLASLTVTTDHPVYRRGQSVQLSGRVTSLDGSGISNIPVAIQMAVNGSTRSFSPYTDAQGVYHITFQPTATDGGTFAVTAGTSVGGVTQTANTVFRIIGLLVSPGSLSQDEVMGSDVTVSLALRNVGDAALTGVNFSVTILPAGAVTATVSQPIASLASGGTVTVPVVITAPAGDPTAGPVSVQVQISATDATSGIGDQATSSIVVTLRPAISIPVLTPTSLSVGINPGRSLTRRFLVRNDGYLPMTDATVTLQNPIASSWVSLGNASLGSLAPGEAREFQVLINPPTNLALGDYAVVLEVHGGTSLLQGSLNISVTQSTIGAAAFIVSDDTGGKVNGATVTLYGVTNGKMFQGVTDTDGQVAIAGVDAGSYAYVVAASSHDPGNGTIVVTAGSTISVPVLMSYNVVSLTFTVTPTTIVDQYNVTLNVAYSTTLPKPALQVLPYSLDLSFFPEDAPNGQFPCSLSITNSHPTASVRDVFLDASQLDIARASGQRIHVLFGDGSTTYRAGELAAKATTTVGCYATVDGGGVLTHAAGSLVVQANYDFSLDGQVLQGTTTTEVPVSYVRPDELFYDPIKFIYDKRTDPANPVLKYDGTSFIYPVKSNRNVLLDLLKPATPFNGRNLVAFTQTHGGTTSLGVINANQSNAFWRADFNAAKQTLSGAGDTTTLDISTLDPPTANGLSLEQALNEQIATAPDQIINRPTYLGFEGQWADLAAPTGYLIPVRIITVLPDAIVIPRPPSSAVDGVCLNPEDQLCKDPTEIFVPPVPSQDGQILLAINQRIRLERQAFNAMLGIGAQAVLTNTVAAIQIRDLNGNDASSKFFVLVTNDPAGATHGGTVSGQASVSWQLIPNADAGGTSPQGTQYTVRATLNYVVSNTAKNATTQTVTITVLPSPKLTVAYTLPFVVMAGKDAKVRVTVRNIGAGTAKNFSVQSMQPRIGESIPDGPPDPLGETPGPLVNFNLTGSSNTADGTGFQPGNLTINFGDVAPGATVSGYWTLRVSRKGFFIDVSSTFSHSDYQGVQLDPLVLPPTTALVPAIGGAVSAESGQGIPGLTLTVSQGGASIGNDQTDQAGVDHIPDLAAGAYLEEVRDLTGAVLASKTITVLSDQATNFIDFLLSDYNATVAIVLVQSDPPGIPFTADGDAFTTPHSFLWDIGSTHRLGASSVVDSSAALGQGGSPGSSSGTASNPVLVGWSDGETSADRPVTVGPGGAILEPKYRSAAEVNQYTRTQITFDAFDHKWPSTNGRGDIIWSQRDAAGYWQVFMQGPSTSVVGCFVTATLSCKVTSDAHNHERPVISDDGTVAWFQDGTGGGLGYTMMRRAPGSSTISVAEFSSRNFSCNPLTGVCNPPQERAAGKTFGIASDGRTISSYTFYEFGNPQYRRFNVTGIGRLPQDSSPANLFGYDSPDITKDDEIVYATGFVSGVSSSTRYVYLATANDPVTHTLIDEGDNPHISDGPGPEIVYIRKGMDVTHWTGSEVSHWVALGLWADVNDTGLAATIVYECVKDGYSQICKAKLVNDCDKPAITPNPPSSVLAGAGWLLTYAVTAKDGLTISDVSLGGRYMAKMMSVPYFNLKTTAFSQNHCELTPDGDPTSDATCTSRLVDFKTSEPGGNLLEVRAKYAVQNIPLNTSSCVVITQDYKFKPPAPGFEPSNTLSGGTFIPDLKYEFIPEDPTEKLISINIPQRMQFASDAPNPAVAETNSAATLMTRDCDAGEPLFKLLLFPRGCGMLLHPTDSAFDIEPAETLLDNPLPMEAVTHAILGGPALVNSLPGEMDNFHQTNRSSIVEPGWTVPTSLLPNDPLWRIEFFGCPECVHIHWRWADYFSFDGPWKLPPVLLGAYVYSQLFNKGWSLPADFGHGQPLIPHGSNQSVDVAVSKYRHGEEHPIANYTSLINGESLIGQPIVLWYSATGFHKKDEFFAHGGFFVANPMGKIVPSLNWPAPRTITYGTPLSSGELNATASIPGTFTYSPPIGTVVDAGTRTLAVTFAPDDTESYATAAASVQIDVSPAVPSLTWVSPVAIVFGTPLGDAQLNATAEVPGTFSYTPAPGTTLNAGESQPLSVTFTPDDATNYTNATATVQISVIHATPTITWTGPGDIVYGTLLGSAQLDAVANVSGAFAYTPGAGTILNAGVGQLLQVTFTPADTTNYTTATATVHIDVTQATPMLTWPKPALIVYGTKLGTAQLDATAHVPGTFAYSPAAGTALNAGGNQTLSVTFTPADSLNYANANANTTIDVARAGLAVKADDKMKPFGAPLPPLAATFSGFVNTDTVGSLIGSIQFVTSASAASPVGSYTLNVSGVSSPNYSIAFLAGTLTVVRASTTNVLVPSTNPASSGQPILLVSTVSVVAPGAGGPTGAVQFFDGSTLVGTAAVVAGPNATASLTVNFASGSHAISAVYSGDASFVGSTAVPITEIVGTGSQSTSTIVTSSLNPAAVGSLVTFMATVSPLAGTATPSGSLQFFDGNTLLATTTLVPVKNGAAASFSSGSLIAGTHLITAKYTGSTNLTGSTSAILTQTTYQSSKPSKVSVTLASNPNPSGLGQAVTFIADLKTSGSSVPTGSVQFVSDGVVIGSAPVNGDKKSSTASLATGSFALGNHQVYALYLGDQNFEGAASTVVVQSVR